MVKRGWLAQVVYSGCSYTALTALWPLPGHLGVLPSKWAGNPGSGCAPANPFRTLVMVSSKPNALTIVCGMLFRVVVCFLAGNTGSVTRGLWTTLQGLDEPYPKVPLVKVAWIYQFVSHWALWHNPEHQASQNVLPLQNTPCLLNGSVAQAEHSSFSHTWCSHQHLDPLSASCPRDRRHFGGGRWCRHFSSTSCLIPEKIFWKAFLKQHFHS